MDTHDALNTDTSWTVVLAGGDGHRMREFVDAWLGHPRPKQYCTFVGRRSMFQHTVDRADRLASADRRVTVAARSHAPHVRAQLEGRPQGRTVFQPRNCGTAVGILLALASVRAADPGASVAILPSDHFVHPEERFLGVIRDALTIVARVPEKLLLVGAVPDEAEPDYGWIVPGDRANVSASGRVSTVRRFIEKPSTDTAHSAMAAGALWNTFVFAGKVATLWSLFREFLPEVTSRFEKWQCGSRSNCEGAVLDFVYEGMPDADFSREVLQKSSDKLLVLELDGVLWSDWGRPERILSSLDRIHRAPAFSPLELAVPVPATNKLEHSQGG